MLESNNNTFSRERLAGYDPERINNSTVLIVGAGALGQNTALDLALSGIGEIRIVDRDRFEEHNRTRSPAFPLPEEQEEYGLNKAEVVARKLRRLMTAPNPVMRFANKWIQELGDGAFTGVSAVVSAVDSRIARAYLSDKARQHGLAFIEGGFEREQLRVTSFPAPNGDDLQTLPCWRCLQPGVEGSLSCSSYARNADVAGVIPAIQNTAAVLGGLQAEATILAIQEELREEHGPKSFSLNIRTWQSYTAELRTDRKCPGVHHASNSEPIKLQATADDSVEKLLREISEHLGSSARLWLPLRTYSKLFWTAPCRNRSCGRLVSVKSPEWRWLMHPRCKNCGGPFEAVSDESNASTYTTPEISLLSKPEVLAATGRQIGLAPLTLVGAAGEDATTAHFENTPPPALFQLPGSIDDLFESGEAS
jgi:molybdopterin/thiamine biosynthesis adenylyltransferase